MSQTIFPPALMPCVPIVGTDKTFPVRRVYCVGRNYAEHAQEMGDTGREAPFFFTKPADAIVTAAHIQYPSLTQDYQHEVELVVAIGVGGSHISTAQASQHIYGYAVGLDMTRRDLQAQMKKAARPWCIAKAVDQSAPIGAITPATQYPSSHFLKAAISLSVNGVRRQHSTLDQMIWSIEDIVAYASSAWELQPGDLIYTGTPAGVASVSRGDKLEAAISGLSALTVTIHPN
jgi:fumarylpyruvate hydrolase